MWRICIVCDGQLAISEERLWGYLSGQYSFFLSEYVNSLRGENSSHWPSSIKETISELTIWAAREVNWLIIWLVFSSPVSVALLAKLAHLWKRWSKLRKDRAKHTEEQRNCLLIQPGAFADLSMIACRLLRSECYITRLPKAWKTSWEPLFIMLSCSMTLPIIIRCPNNWLSLWVWASYLEATFAVSSRALSHFIRGSLALSKDGW